MAVWTQHLFATWGGGRTSVALSLPGPSVSASLPMRLTFNSRTINIGIGHDVHVLWMKTLSGCGHHWIFFFKSQELTGSPDTVQTSLKNYVRKKTPSLWEKGLEFQTKLAALSWRGEQSEVFVRSSTNERSSTLREQIQSRHWNNTLQSCIIFK